MNKSILYIGNDLRKSTRYTTTMDTLSYLLSSSGYNIYKSSSKVNKGFRLLDMWMTIIRLRKKLDFVLIDTFSSSNFYYALVTSQLCRFYRLKYLPILHGGNLPYRLKKYPKLSSLVFKNSYVNIAPSGYLKYEFEQMGFKTQLIPNIIPIVDYSYKERKKITPKLLYVRAFAKTYNSTMAIEVMKKLIRVYPMATLCMIGPDKDGTLADVQDLISTYGLDKSVEITGVLAQKEWHKKSKAFDIFINTTNIDNTPVSVIEAMALGLPVVSTNVGGLPYLIQHNVDGVLVEKNNPSAMTTEICKILEENKYSLALNARKKVENFDWNIVKSKWMKILQ
jgi:glycosyltransferase involved in cell wall biosynthesis